VSCFLSILTALYAQSFVIVANKFTDNPNQVMENDPRNPAEARLADYGPNAKY